MSEPTIQLTPAQRRILELISDGRTWHLLDAPRGREYLLQESEFGTDTHVYRQSVNDSTITALQRAGMLERHRWHNGSPTSKLASVRGLPARYGGFVNRSDVDAKRVWPTEAGAAAVGGRVPQDPAQS